MKTPAIFQTKTYITIDANQNLKEEKFSFIFRILRALGAYSNSHLKAAAIRCNGLLTDGQNHSDEQVQLALKVISIVNKNNRKELNKKNIKVVLNDGKYSVTAFDIDNGTLSFHKISRNKYGSHYLNDGSAVDMEHSARSLDRTVQNSLLFKHLVAQK